MSNSVVKVNVSHNNVLSETVWAIKKLQKLLLVEILLSKLLMLVKKTSVMEVCSCFDILLANNSSFEMPSLVI